MSKLISKSVSREQAYDVVQALAMESFETKTNFRDLLINNKFIMEHLSLKEVNDCFTLDYYVKNVNYIFKKVFK